MSRRHLAALLAVFALTRLTVGWLADHPEVYAPSTFGAVTGDVIIYEGWAITLMGNNIAAYSGIGIEYPPGALPFLTIPELFRGWLPYRQAFVMLMVLVDAAGFAGLLLLARRWGSALGAWAWTLLLPMLGPLVYLRLDLVPAVATVWAVAAMATGSWFGGGAWLGFGAAAKVYPGFLLPVVFIIAPRRRDVVWGAAILIAGALLPFVRYLGDVAESVGLYHAQRGIQLESLWASLVLVAGRLGHQVGVVFNFGAAHIESDATAVLKPLALAASLGIVALAAWLTWMRVPTGDAQGGVMVLLATLAGLLAVGTVFSPQFLIWLVALAAAALCVPRSPVRWPAALLIPVVVLTHVIFPFRYGRLMIQEGGMVAALLARNLLVAAIAVAVFVLVARLPRVRRGDPERAAALEQQPVQ